MLVCLIGADAIMGFSEDRAQGRFGSRYVLVAENPYLLWDAVEHWKATWRKTQPVSCEVFQAPKIDFDRLLDIGATIPMFAETRLVLIRDINKILESQHERLLQTLNRFSDTTKALLTATDLDKRKKLYKGLSSWGSFEEFPRIYDDKLPGWAQRIAGDFGWRLSPDAAELLASACGDDLFSVRQTIERVTLFLDRQRRIEVADVENMLAGEGIHTIFLLLDAVAQHDLGRSLAIVRSLFAGGEYPGVWLSALSRLLGKLAKLAELKEPNDFRAAELTGMKPFLVKKSRAQIEAYGEKNLPAAILACCETEWGIKTSQVSNRMGWEILVWRLCSRPVIPDFSILSLNSPRFRE